MAKIQVPISLYEYIKKMMEYQTNYSGIGNCSLRFMSQGGIIEFQAVNEDKFFRQKEKEEREEARRMLVEADIKPPYIPDSSVQEQIEEIFTKNNKEVDKEEIITDTVYGGYQWTMTKKKLSNEQEKSLKEKMKRSKSKKRKIDSKLKEDHFSHTGS